MKPTKQLILAFRETARRIREKPEEYNWSVGSRCNCGILCQTLLGVDAGELATKYRVYGLWECRVLSGFCKQTNLPVDDLFKILCSFGLERDDFRRIEDCDARKYNDPQFVASWFDSEADRLEALRISQPFNTSL